MEKNQVIGFALIFLILIGWSVLNAPSEEEIKAAKEKQRIEEVAQEKVSSAAPTVEEIINPAPVSDEAAKDRYGIFAAASQGSQSTSTLSNDKMTVSFSNKGGKLVGVSINDRLKITETKGEPDQSSPVLLFEDEKNRFNYTFPISGRQINTEDLYFTPSENGNSISFKAITENGGFIEQKYTLDQDGYNIAYELNTSGISSYFNAGQPVVLSIENYLDPIEVNRTFETRYSTVYYKEKDEDTENCSCMGDDEESLPEQKIEWTSFVNQFFNTSFIAKETPFDGMVTTVETFDKESPDMKKATAVLNVPIDASNTSFAMDIYSGPNEYELLKKYDNDIEEVIPFGNSIFGDINRHFIRPFFNWLSQFVSSKGLVIICMIFIIKMALYPLTYKMLHSQAKMSALKPQLAGLKEKFKDDAQKQQMETMKVYREYGVSPFGGCLPMIAQIPIWYALFRFFPASITFRQESFLWAKDLSSFDAFFNLPFDIPQFGAHLSLFTVLWAISQVIYTFYNSKHMDMSANPAMKYVQYLMPVMFFVFFNNYASGLTCYMLFSNLFNIAQTVITKKFIFNEKKILDELNIKKAKPKKKGGFQQKLEEAMKRQQEIQKKKEGQGKKKK